MKTFFENIKSIYKRQELSERQKNALMILVDDAAVEQQNHVVVTRFSKSGEDLPFVSLNQTDFHRLVEDWALMEGFSVSSNEEGVVRIGGWD